MQPITCVAVLLLAATTFSTAATAEPVAPPATPDATSTKPYTYVVDDKKQTHVFFIGDSTFIVQPDRVGVLTDSGVVNWDKFSAGLVKARNTHSQYQITSIRGTSVDNLWLEMVVQLRAFPMSSYFHYEPGEGWKEMWPTPDDLSLAVNFIVPTANGAIAQWGLLPQAGDQAHPKGGHWLVASGDPVPPFETKNFTALQIVPFANGEMWALGSQCKARVGSSGFDGSECKLQVRRWTPGGKVITDTIPIDVETTNDSLLAVSPTDAVLQADDKLFRFTGKAWQAMPWNGRPLEANSLHRGPDGTLWNVTSEGNGEDPAQIAYEEGTGGVINDSANDRRTMLEHRNANGAIETLPTPGNADGIYGIEVGAPWASLGHDKVARWDQTKKKWIFWHIPRPAKDVKRTMGLPHAGTIVVRAPDDVWISVDYDNLDRSGKYHQGPEQMDEAPSHGALLHLTSLIH